MRAAGLYEISGINFDPVIPVQAITNDVEARIKKHNSGKGAKYTRGRAPVFLKASWEYNTKAEAASAEYAFKQLTREQKLKLIANARNGMSL